MASGSGRTTVACRKEIENAVWLVISGGPHTPLYDTEIVDHGENSIGPPDHHRRTLPTSASTERRWDTLNPVLTRRNMRVIASSEEREPTFVIIASLDTNKMTEARVDVDAWRHPARLPRTETQTTHPWSRWRRGERREMRERRGRRRRRGEEG